MTITIPPADLRERLVQTLYDGGYLTDPTIADAFRRVPRHLFAPAVYRVDSFGQTGDIMRADLETSQGEYLTAVYSDDAIVTQIGAHGQPTSSSTQPGVMAVMLEALQLSGREQVLEIGTGTGYNAALLSHRLGQDQVTSVDIDPHLITAARVALDKAGYHPHLDAADGLEGYPHLAPYDRITATCSVRRVPAAWLRQTRPGGIILTNMSYGVAPLHIDQDGTGSGRFLPQVAAFIEARPADGPPGPSVEQLIGDAINLDATNEPAGPAAAAMTNQTFEFFWRLILPDLQDCAYTILDDDLHFRFVGDGESTVRVNYTGTTPTVTQAGPRRLWDEIATAYLWWDSAGRPTHDRLGLTVTANGQHTLWVDDPATPYRWPLN